MCLLLHPRARVTHSSHTDHTRVTWYNLPAIFLTMPLPHKLQGKLRRERLWLNYNTMLHQTFNCFYLNEAKRVIVIGCWMMLNDVECVTFNLFVMKKEVEISVLFLFNKCFSKHCVTVYPDPNTSFSPYLQCSRFQQ